MGSYGWKNRSKAAKLGQPKSSKIFKLATEVFSVIRSKFPMGSYGWKNRSKAAKLGQPKSSKIFKLGN